MKYEKRSQLMIEKLLGEITEARNRELKKYLDSDKASREEMEALENVWGLMNENAPARLPYEWKASVSRALKETKEEKSFRRTSVPFPWKTVAAVLVLGICLMTWSFYDDSTGEQQEDIIQLISGENAATRIQGIYAMMENDETLVSGIPYLLELLKTDSRNSVRLAAFEALLKADKGENIRDQLIRSMSYQHSPHIQLLFIHHITVWDDKRALPYLLEIRIRPETDALLKQKIDEAVKTLG